MKNTGKLAGRTIFITGASRGIGKAIALKAAKDGANVVIAAKTAEPHPKLPGTIYTAAEEIEKAGGKALPCIVDVRNEQQVRDAVRKAVETFGGIDILVNNASAISITPTCETDMKKYDLMHSINTRGTFLVSKECNPYLKKSNHAHILNISPPLSMDPRWFEKQLAYTMAKYGMSMCVLGMAQEFKNDHIAVNALWPLTIIHTAAIDMLQGPEGARYSRTPEIMADAAYEIFCRDPKTFTGNFLIDELILQEAGVTDFKQYACNPNEENLMLDFFLDETIYEKSLSLHGNRTTLSGGKIEKLFSKIQGHFSEELVKKLQAVIVFNITGKESGTWYLDLKNGSGKYGQGQPPTPADARILVDFKIFEEILTGKRKAMNAYLSKKMKITGKVKLGLKIDTILALPSKL